MVTQAFHRFRRCTAADPPPLKTAMRHYRERSSDPGSRNKSDPKLVESTELTAFVAQFPIQSPKAIEQSIGIIDTGRGLGRRVVFGPEVAGSPLSKTR